MLLGDINKDDNIIISFDIGDKHFDFTTSLLRKVDKNDPLCTIYTDPITIHGNNLHIDNKRCLNQRINYHNQKSGRNHTWKDPKIEYVGKPRGHYVIKCPSDSIPENRRSALRVPINYKASCTMSDLQGKYPCTVFDVSVMGVGINIDIALAEKNPMHRLVYTKFKDEYLNKDFYITAKVLHATQLDIKTVRCGCEIISVEPSINEYINIKQMHSLAKAGLYEESENKKSNASEDNDGIMSDNDAGSMPDTEKKDHEADFSEKFKRDHPISFIYHGDICPICGQGNLTLIDGAYVCSACESIIEP